MSLKLYSLKIFEGTSGLSVSVFSDKGSNGQGELENVVKSIETFYKSHLNDNGAEIPRESKRLSADSLSYKVLSSTGEIGSVRITPKGTCTKNGDSCKNEDYSIRGQREYLETNDIETYWIYFRPKDISLRREHRDGYADFIDPLEKKRNKNGRRTFS